MLWEAMARIKAFLAKYPAACILAALLLIGLYGRYTLGQDRTTLCHLIGEPLEWSAGAEIPVARDGSIDADALAQERTQLATEESLRGDLWRWQHAYRDRIEEICAEAEDDGRED